MSDGYSALGGINMGPGSIKSLMSNPDGIAEMLQQSSETGDSPADIFADIVNVHRVDIRRLGLALGADVEAAEMSPQEAAVLLAGTVDGDGVKLVEMFNQMAEKRDRLLREALDEDEYEAFMAGKQAMMNTGEPGGFEDDEEE